MDRHIVKNRIGYLLLWGEREEEERHREGPKEEREHAPRENSEYQDGERGVGVPRSGCGLSLKVTVNHNN